jgi:hypothetical protein
MTLPDGSTQYVTLERADEPTVVGTALNKALFDSIQADFDSLNSKIMIPEMHRMIYRGKYLGTKPTDKQIYQIEDGTFEDLWLGDYWSNDGYDWVIGDINYWLNCGDTAFTKNHLLMIPRVSLYQAQMNSSNTTAGAYAGSEMYKTNINKAKTIISDTFGDTVLTHREYLTNAVTNGKPSGGAWYDSTVEIPNECMMYGHPHMSPVSDGSTVPVISTIDKTQLALFAVCPHLIPERANTIWLRDVVSSTAFAYVSYHSMADYRLASASLGVRPVFAIG